MLVALSCPAMTCTCVFVRAVGVLHSTCRSLKAKEAILDACIEAVNPYLLQIVVLFLQVRTSNVTCAVFRERSGSVAEVVQLSLEYEVCCQTRVLAEFGTESVLIPKSCFVLSERWRKKS